MRESHHRDEVADVQGIRSRIKTDVGADSTGAGTLFQFLRMGGLLEKTAFSEGFQEGQRKMESMRVQKGCRPEKASTVQNVHIPQRFEPLYF